MIRAEIQHTLDSCLRLALVQDKCFGHTRRIVRLVLASLLIIAGFFVGFDIIWGILLAVLGVMFYYFTSYMYEQDAERAFRMTPEKYRNVSYRFSDQCFTAEAGGEMREVSYDKVCFLADDGKYYYLFINPQQAYMMEVTEGGKKASQALEAFVEEKTKKKWKSVKAQEPFFRVMRKNLSQKGW